MGLMQLCLDGALAQCSNLLTRKQNVNAGVRHLRRLLDSYGGDVR